MDDTLTLRRFGSIPGQGTYGRINYGDTYANTIEQLWRFNEPFKSCVPCGTYELIPFYSNRFKINTYALQSQELGVWPTQEEMESHGGTRYACIFHAANIPSQLRGCIAAGNKFTWFTSINNHHPQMGVQGSSKERTARLTAFMHDDIRFLKIAQEASG